MSSETRKHMSVNPARVPKAERKSKNRLQKKGVKSAVGRKKYITPTKYNPRLGEHRAKPRNRRKTGSSEIGGEGGTGIKLKGKHLGRSAAERGSTRRKKR